MKSVTVLLAAVLWLAVPASALNITSEDTYGTLARLKKVDLELVVDAETMKALGLGGKSKVAQLGDEFEAKLAAAGLDVVPNGPMAKEARWTVMHVEIWARKSGASVVFSVGVHLILGVRPCKGCKKSYAATWVLNTAGITAEGNAGLAVQTVKQYFDTFLNDWKSAAKEPNDKVVE